MSKERWGNGSTAFQKNIEVLHEVKVTVNASITIKGFIKIQIT